jgi:hypothetical protein
MTQGRVIGVKFAGPLAFELDGGERGYSRRLTVAVVPAALTFCVPEEQSATRRRCARPSKRPAGRPSWHSATRQCPSNRR